MRDCRTCANLPCECHDKQDHTPCPTYTGPERDDPRPIGVRPIHHIPAPIDPTYEELVRENKIQKAWIAYLEARLS